MRNKLDRSKNFKDTTCQGKGQTQTTEVITLLLSESSCDDDNTSPEGGSASLAAGNKYGSNAAVVAADISKQEVELLWEEKKKPCSAKDIKIAPIFLRQSKNKRSSKGKLEQPVEQKPVPPQREEVRGMKSQRRVSSSTVSHFSEKDGFSLSTSRLRFSPSSLHTCLEEIKASNPAFPVHTVFSTLQKKASENLQDLGCTAENSQQNHFKEKRKREDGSSERLSKRLRCSLTAEDPAGLDQCHLSVQCVQESPAVLVKKQPRTNKLSRSHRLRQQNESLKAQSNNCEPNSEWTDDTQSVGQPLMTTCDILHRDFSFQDALWTDKYHPQCSNEVIGNSVQVNKLHSWLKKWKLRADCSERRKMEEQKDEDNSSGITKPLSFCADLWDCGDFQGEAGAEDSREDPLCNTMLITGPPGVGKTASVYACAQELGFKVFEVNCSSQRSGRHVLSQLKEATQSHLVETQGKDLLKPAYLSNSSCTPKPEPCPGKTVPLKNVISTTKKRTVQKFGRSGRKGKARPATVTLANYFKMKAKADHLHFGGPSPSEKQTARSRAAHHQAVIKQGHRANGQPHHSFYLKRSLVQREIRLQLGGNRFQTPSVVNVCSYLQLVCLAENMQLELDDVCSLLRLTCGDVRRCLLQLQLWVLSGGGQAFQNRGVPEEPNHTQCCTATMLGLQSVTQNQLLNLLKCQHWSETDMNKLLNLLAESWRGGVPLLYTNLELLLPISANEISVHYLDKVTCSGLQCELAPSGTKPHFQQPNRNVSPKTSATNRKSVRNNSRLSRRKYNAAVSDTTAEIKDSLLDEMSEELDRSWSQERMVDIQVAAEGLGFHRCWWRVSEAWTKAQNHSQDLEDKKLEKLMERLMFPNTSKRQSLRFGFQLNCTQSVSQGRYELSRTVLSSKAFSLLGNRQAVSVDYMPVLRSICRFHRAQQQEAESVR
ncbi:hypothetical protein INR49_029428 [Caranx melampygus]|nr:hypothetical protein INR49_029428 [Caranx melampygus]